MKRIRRILLVVALSLVLLVACTPSDCSMQMVAGGSGICIQSGQ